MLTRAQRQEREARVRDMLDRGMSLSQMARELGITSQSVHKFIVRKGWQTAEMAARRGEVMTVQDDPELAAKREKRKAMKTRVDRSGSTAQKG